MRILFAVLLAALLAALIWQRSRYKKLQKEINYISSRLENLPVASENGLCLNMTEKSLIADFHFCATVSASGVNEKACSPSVFASRSARFATVLFSVKHLTGSFGSSGCSF